MKYYIEIAKQYFQYLEGRELYPWGKSFLFWIWVFVSSVWLSALVLFFVVDNSHREVSAFLFIFIPEIVWLIITFKISAWKERRFVEVTNNRLGTKFESAAEGRLHVLRDVISVPPSEFLKIAKEINDLISLQRKFRKYSDLTFSEVGRNIYDRESKARLLTLTIALVSMSVALAVKSNVTLETVFEIFSDPGWQKFMMFVAFGAAILFLALIGLRVFLLTIIDGLVSWSIRLLKSSLFTDWLLAYLIRDLIYYHSRSQQLSRSVEYSNVIENSNSTTSTILAESKATS